ncbi:MAG TPA: lipid A core--O-antigen ligase, partial [Polyangiaceae bacterium]|nr:lipid A core--O-antigen ligase [Polyangiaceae bacterium]
MANMGRGLSSYTLALALGLSALAAGAVHLGILAAFAVLVIASGLLATREDPPNSAPWGSRELVATGVWSCLAAVCLLQSVPLPLDWVRTLAPDNADIWARALRPWNLPEPALAPLSLAPGRSVVEALKAASYALSFAVAFQLGRQGKLRHLAWVGFGAALSVGLVTAAHQISGAQHLYGTYQPVDAYDAAPLLNANNRAGYLNLGFFCGLGLLFHAGARPLAALVGSGLVLLAAEILLCESVGGSGCLAIGLVLAALLPRGNPRRQGRPELGRWLQAGIVIAIGLVALGMAFAARRSTLGWSGQTFEKLELFSGAWRLAREHFGFGVGRGAFGSVFAAYQGPNQQGISEHVENFPIQWAAEWGIPVTLSALLALGWSLWPLLSKRTFSSPVRRCTLIGCVVLLLQNQVDLGLEIPAVAALLCSLLGAL